MSWYPQKRDQLGVPGVTTSPAEIAAASRPEFQNQLWLADLAPITNLEAPLYLGVILDCATACCLAWRFSAELEPDLIVGAVEEALILRSPLERRPAGAKVALALAERCAAADVGLPSLALPADDRRVSADFFNWLSADLLTSASWSTGDQARRAIRVWIQGAYNPAVVSPSLALPLDRVIHEDAEGRSS